MTASMNIARLPIAKNTAINERFNAKDRINEAITPEIVIALCGPLGTPLHRVAETLKTLLEESHKYTHADIIRLSEYIKEHGNPNDKKSIKDLIESGNELRRKHGNSILAQLAIQKIATSRELNSKPTKQTTPQLNLEGITDDDIAISPSPVVRHCHIIDSIKNTDELELLRSIYGRLLHVISVYSPTSLRIQELEQKIVVKSDVYNLIDRDSGEEIGNGQSVRDIFPKADFFLRVNDGTDEQIRANLSRYLDLLLGVKVITPTPDERAMYEAHSAARNSACLSRQVGAAITDNEGEVLAVGWNDVPRPFGGLYESIGRPNEVPYIDHRCWNKDGGKCFNDQEKSEIAKKLTTALIKEGIIKKEDEENVTNRLRKSSEVRGLIEFSRAVHAEMHALLNAGHSAGSRIKGGKLYVTTYPCHSCARHIIASGIKEVRFIEPYRKSLATRLHSDAITESESDDKKVRIIPFDGVAPVRFLDLFSEGPYGRKDPSTGKMRPYRISVPVTAVTMEAVTTLENLALRELKSTDLLNNPI